MENNKSGRIIKNAMVIAALFVGMTSLTSFGADKLPEAKDYPVNTIYTGNAAKDIDNSDEFTHEFRTRFKEAMQGDVVFAGEYAQAGWGCGGSGCHTVALINKRTGRALDKAFTVYYGGGGADDGPLSIGEEVVFMDKNSKLLITSGDDETTGKSFSYYYILEGNELKLIRKVEEKGEE